MICIKDPPILYDTWRSISLCICVFWVDYFIIVSVQVHQLGPSTLLPLRKNRGACGGLVVVAAVAAFLLRSLARPSKSSRGRSILLLLAIAVCYGLRLLLQKHRYGFGYSGHMHGSRSIIYRLGF